MEWDQTLTRAINQDLANPILDALFVAVSLFGSLLPFALVGLAPWFQGNRRAALAVWVAIALGEVLAFGLKEVIARPRPDDLRVLLPAASEFAMPSGHATRAFAAVAALWTAGAAYRRALLPFGVLTALARPYVGVHYASDVAAGALLGLLLGTMVHYAARAAAYEATLPVPQRVPTLQRAARALAAGARWIWQVDYLYTLRLLGRIGQDQLRRFGRVSLYWGLIRLGGPIFMIAVAWFAYAWLYPGLAARTAGCLVAYFTPFGIEFGIPACIGFFKVPWWVVVAAILYIDAWLALLLIYNFDFLYKVPGLGRWLAKAHVKGTAFVRKRPWILRIQFFGVMFFVFVPLAGTGVPPAVVLGRFIGMGKFLLWTAVMLGTGLRITLIALGSDAIFKLF